MVLQAPNVSGTFEKLFLGAVFGLKIFLDRIVHAKTNNEQPKGEIKDSCFRILPNVSPTPKKIMVGPLPFFGK